MTLSLYSRWLPTVLCAAHDKLLINAALGFDSYLVMRHGCSPLEGTKAVPTSASLPVPVHVSAPVSVPAPNPPLVLDLLASVPSSSSSLSSYQHHPLPSVATPYPDIIFASASTSTSTLPTQSASSAISFFPKSHKSHKRLGCYYCSDIVAATNSQRDRSLDQQCTVTRYVHL